MPDTKITALTAIGANPIIPSTFPIPMVDLTDTSMAASGTTKKVTVNQILGAGGTATLASATITGAATVGTTFGVTGVSTFAAGTALLPALTTTGDTNTGIYYPAADTFAVTTAGAERYRVDSAGNCGIGVTPSAWVAGAKALQFGAYGALAQSSSGNIELSFNSYNSGAGAYKYLQTDTASLYRASSVHSWFVAPSGTAGNAITFTQAMTLDASGNLFVKKTASGSTTLGVELLATGQINGATANQDNLNIYNTTAAAYRFYVNASGTVFATNTTISAISDARFKENVQDIDVGLGAILALKPRKFDWKDGKGKNIKGDRGFIAQEFETVFPNLIDEWKENAPEGEAPYKSVRQDLIPVLVKAIQELTARVQTLEAK
jgi:hypothetical protein